MQTRCNLDHLQLIGPIVRAESALLERMLETKELFGVVGQLIGYEGPEIFVRIVCDRTRRESEDDESSNKDGTANPRYTHYAFLPRYAAERAAGGIVADRHDVVATRVSIPLCLECG